MCSSTSTSNSTDLLSHCITHESHLEFIISTLCSKEANTSFFISISERCTQLMGIHTFTYAQPHARPTQQIFFLIALHRRIIWSSSQLFVRRRLAQCSSSVSDRNHTPISGALSQVCVLEDVSRSCNHQHSLSAREAFSTRPSLSQKYSNFVFANSLVKIYVICSWVGRYCTCIVFLCTMSLI
jgi:hypothetical protein